MEILGIGTDLVDVPRFRAVAARTPRILDRLFTDDERAYAEQRADPTERFAVRFAAKEAVLKALGIGLFEFPIRDVEVIRFPSGEPGVRLHRRAAAAAEAAGVRELKLSLTHTEQAAHAVAVALG